MVSYFIKINELSIGSVIGESHYMIEDEKRFIINDSQGVCVCILHYNEIRISNSKIESLKDDYDVKIKL